MRRPTTVLIEVLIETELLDRLGGLTPDELSECVNEALAEKLDARDAEALRHAMVEGYRAAARDHESLAREWDVVAAPGWPV